MLWTAIHLPSLPLQVFLRATPSSKPVVIDEGSRVLACNQCANTLGVKPGMRTSAALALASSLRICSRDQVAEIRALKGIAAWAQQFTPMSSLAPPNSVLLEIGGCLNIFQGLNKLTRRVHSGLSNLGYDNVAIATAPTSSGALLLAQAGRETQLTTLPHRIR